MIENETTSGGFAWRKRALATVGIAAVVAAGSVAVASSANAATPPTLTATAPTTIVNDNTMASKPLSIRVNNAGTGAGVPVNTGGADFLSLSVTAPAGLLCSNITLTPEATAPTSVAAATSPMLTDTTPAAMGTCTFTSPTFTQPINSDVTYNYGVQVQGSGNATATPPVAGITGSVGFTASLRETLNGNTLSIATSNTSTSSLVSPTANNAAAFSGTAPTAATIYSPYNFTEATSVGTPASTFSVFYTDRVPDPATSTYLAADTGTRTNTFPLFDTTSDTTAEAGLSLNVDNTGDSGFYFDTVTGKISYYSDATGDLVANSPVKTDATPDYAFTLIANNGTGGYNPTGGVPPTVPGVGAGSQSKPTPTVNLHDVDSTPFSLPVLFSDVTATSTFGPSIYDLSDDAAISGFSDGTFKPAQSVTRQEFVQILFKSGGNAFPGGGIAGTGECTTIEPSAFSDVPNASPFCEAIKRLNQVGIIKGGTDGKFNPGSLITREQVAGFLYRAYSFETTQNIATDATFTSPSPFSDVTASNVFGGDIEFLASKKIVNGSTNGTFRPKSATNRGETAAFIDRTQQAAL